MPNSAVSLPARRIAIVQSESESLHNPSLDVTGVLVDRERWRFQLFTDRTFAALLKAQAEFDCIVIGYNAIHRNPGIAPLLAQARVGVLMLHQLHLPDGTRLGPVHALSVKELPGAHHDVSVAPERDRELEILLHWPDSVEVAGLNAEAVLALAPPPDTPWRPVLQAGNGLPVLIRSSLTHSPPVAACTLLLQNSDPAHRSLLANLITFCAGGPPTTVVLGDERSPWAGTLVRKLRLRRVNTVELDPAGDDLSYRGWPLRGVADVIVSRDHRAIDGEEEWLARGGRLTAFDPDTGELHVRYRAPDVRWVARRWSTWLQSGPDEDRRGSVMATRAYLRTLAVLEHEMGDGEPQRLGLRDVASHAQEVFELVNRRLGDGDNLEGTIAATAAVVELAELVPDAVASARIDRVRDWLRGQATTAGPRDRLEIARVLKDHQLLGAAVNDLPRPVSASTIVRLRRAARACGTTDLAFPLTNADRDAILAEIVTSLLAAAEYLSSMAEFQSDARMSQDGLACGDALLADAAVATVTKHGTIASSGDGSPGPSGEGTSQPERSPGPTVEEVSAEALALIACGGLDSVPTSELVKVESVPPVQFIDDVLRESLDVRQSNTQLRAERADLEQGAQRASGDLVLARNLLGGTVTAVAVIVAVLLAVFLGAQTAGLPEAAAELAGPLTAFVVVLFLLGYPLKHRNLCPDWLVKLVNMFADGASSFRGTLSDALGRAASRDGQDNPDQPASPDAPR